MVRDAALVMAARGQVVAGSKVSQGIEEILLVRPLKVLFPLGYTEGVMG